MKAWKELPESILSWMEFLGHFGPTAGHKYLKGYMADDDEPGVGKVYLSADDLRKLADACNSAAAWLDSSNIPTPAPTPCPDLHREMLTVVEDMIDSDEDRMLHGDTEEDRRVFHYGAKRLKELRSRLIALSPTPNEP